MFSLFQLITPKFPVVVKIGHAHQGMGKVRKLVQPQTHIFHFNFLVKSTIRTYTHILNCNFRDTIREIQYFLHSTDKVISGKEKQLIGTIIVHTEHSLSFSFYHTFCRAGKKCVGQVQIKVYQPYLASAFQS